MKISRYGITWGTKAKQESSEAPNKTGAKKVTAGQISRPKMALFGRYGTSPGTSVPVARRGNIIFDIDVDRLKQYPAATLLSNLNSLSPDASMAIWHILRLCGTKIDYEVFDQNGKESPRGIKYMDELIGGLNKQSGGVGNLITQGVKTVYVQGACSCEVVLELNLKDTKKLAMIDPASVTFFQETRGEGEMMEIVFVPKQLQDGKYVSLEKPGFFYIPLDPDIGDPNGTSPILSILQTIFYYMRILYDLNQVVHNQAWERLHVKVLEEVLRKNVSDQLKRSDKKMAAYIDDQLDKITAVYNSLEPDDTFVTTDATEIKEVGGKNSGGTVMIKILMTAIDRMMANSLKVMSSLLNQHIGKTETYSSVEWMIQASGIDAIRNIIKSMLDSAFTFMLQAKGIQGRVVISFPTIPLNGIETEEKTAFYRTQRILMERDAGIIDHDHAANLLYDLPAAEGPEVAVEGKGQGKPSLDLSRALVDSYKGGWHGLKNSKLRSLETAFREDLEFEYDRMAEKIISELSETAKLQPV